MTAVFFYPRKASFSVVSLDKLIDGNAGLADGASERSEGERFLAGDHASLVLPA